MLRDQSVPEHVKQQALSLLNANPVLRRSTPAGRRAGPPVDVIGATQIPGGKWAIDVSAPERGGIMGALGSVPLIGRAFRGDPNQRAPLTMNRTSDPDDPLATFSDEELNDFFGGGVFATEAGTSALSNPFVQNSLVERMRRSTAPDRAAMQAVQSLQRRPRPGCIRCPAAGHGQRPGSGCRVPSWPCSGVSPELGRVT